MTNSVKLDSVQSDSEVQLVPSQTSTLEDVMQLYGNQAYIVVDPAMLSSPDTLAALQQLQNYSAEALGAVIQQYQQYQLAYGGYGCTAVLPTSYSEASYDTSETHSKESTSASQSSSSEDGDKRSYDARVTDLEDMLKQLNPNAEEYVPPTNQKPSISFSSSYLSMCRSQPKVKVLQRKGAAWRRPERSIRPPSEESIKRTVYVTDIDQQVTEEQVATLFASCGQVVDCRICGDPNSVLRFAFVEFTAEEGAKKAMTLAGTMLGYYPLRVLPSKTAILPVNPKYLPKSQDEREKCARTVYCTNIDKRVTQADVKLFFESLCGEVSCLRLLGDHQQFTRKAFVQFVMAESAMSALSCSGAILGGLPIRVSPSKTPLRYNNGHFSN